MTPGEGVALAKARSVVRLPDGRTGRLVYFPPGHGHPRRGRKAVVLLPSGRFLSIPTEEVTAC